MKFTCYKHGKKEIRTETSRTMEDTIFVHPCPACLKQAREGGKQFALNEVCKVFIDVIREKEDE